MIKTRVVVYGQNWSRDWQGQPEVEHTVDRVVGPIIHAHSKLDINGTVAFHFDEEPIDHRTSLKDVNVIILPDNKSDYETLRDIVNRFYR